MARAGKSREITTLEQWQSIKSKAKGHVFHEPDIRQMKADVEPDSGLPEGGHLKLDSQEMPARTRRTPRESLWSYFSSPQKWVSVH